MKQIEDKATKIIKRDSGEVGERDDVTTESTTTDKAEAAPKSTAEHINTDKAGEWTGSDDESQDDAAQTKSAVTSVTTLGLTGVTAETARRLGIDRHAEAGLAERAYAEAYAEKVGGTVVDDGSSAFTPDGGIDSIVKTESGQQYVQSKHYGHEVRNSTLEQYAGDVDAIGATNGIAEGVNPEAHGIDVITGDDWPWWRKVEREVRRIIRGSRRAITILWNGTWTVACRLIDGARFVGQRTVTGGKWLSRRLIKIGSTIAAWYARRSLMTQLILIFAVIGLVYLLWRWYTNKE